MAGSRVSITDRPVRRERDLGSARSTNRTSRLSITTGTPRSASSSRSAKHSRARETEYRFTMYIVHDGRWTRRRADWSRASAFVEGSPCLQASASDGLSLRTRTPRESLGFSVSLSLCGPIPPCLAGRVDVQHGLLDVRRQRLVHRPPRLERHQDLVGGDRRAT